MNIKEFSQGLFDGEMDPRRHSEPTNNEYRTINSEIEEHSDYFRGILQEEDRKRFEEFAELITASNNEFGYHFFTFGYRFGINLLLDALYGPMETDGH